MRRFTWVRRDDGTPIFCGAHAKCLTFYKRHGGYRRGLRVTYIPSPDADDREYIAEIRFACALAQQ